MTNSTIHPALVAILTRIALGASAVGREISWDISSNGRAVFVWDTPSADPTFTDSPCFVADNTAESVEHIARAFAHYL